MLGPLDSLVPRVKEGSVDLLVQLVAQVQLDPKDPRGQQEIEDNKEREVKRDHQVSPDHQEALEEMVCVTILFSDISVYQQLTAQFIAVHSKYICKQ